MKLKARWLAYLLSAMMAVTLLSGVNLTGLDVYAGAEGTGRGSKGTPGQGSEPGAGGQKDGSPESYADPADTDGEIHADEDSAETKDTDADADEGSSDDAENTSDGGTGEEDDEEDDSVETDAAAESEDEDAEESEDDDAVESEEGDEDDGTAEEEALRDGRSDRESADERVALTADAGNGITVTVSGSEEALGSAAAVEVGVVTGKDETYADEAGAQTGEDYEVLTVLDITLVDEEGRETEPDGSVEVTISGSAIENYTRAIGTAASGTSNSNAQASVGEDADSGEDVILVSSAEDFFSNTEESSPDSGDDEKTASVSAIVVIHVSTAPGEGYESVASVTNAAAELSFTTESFSDFAIMQVIGETRGTEYDVTGSEGSLSSGVYRLTADVDLSAVSEDETAYDLTVPSGTRVTLDLAGYTLTGTGDGSVITVNGTFTLTDSAASGNSAAPGDSMAPGNSAASGDSDGTDTSGTITGGNTTSGGGVYVADGGVFTMTGGTISGNTARNGGGVYVADGGSFTMNGGSISGNEAQNGYGDSSGGGSGGGVFLSGSSSDTSFTMTGGTISGNSGYYGGGVALSGSDATFSLRDRGIISDNTASSHGGGVYVNAGSFTMTGGAISDNGFTTATSDDAEETVTAVTSRGGGVYVTGSSSVLTIRGGSISGNQVTRMGGGVYASGTAFTFAGGSISDNTAGTLGGGIFLISAAELTMSGGAAISGNAAGDGGGVDVDGTGCTFTMRGGSISGNKANYTDSDGDVDGRGGGVYVYTGNTFTMSGGTISGNEAGLCGGVYLAGGTTSSSDEASSSSGGEFSLSGGTISQNTAQYGGGISAGHMSTSTSYVGPVFTMSGGTVSGNQAVSDNEAYGVGGGIAVFTDGASITAGTISGNEAYCGGGIYLHGNNYMTFSLTLNNVVVTENTASVLGGGIWTCPLGTVASYVTEGAAVYNNTAEGTDGSLASGDAIVHLGNGEGQTVLSSRMLGGGALTWYLDGGATRSGSSSWAGDATDSVGRYPDFISELTDLTLTDSTALEVVTAGQQAESLAMALGEVFITGNSASRGGGIATNGPLTLGDSSASTTSVTVTKFWKGENNASPVRPASITVDLYNTVTVTDENGHVSTQKYLIDTEVVTKDDDGNWTVTFDNLPVDSRFSYSVEERRVDGYTVEITGGLQEDGTYAYTVTNTYAPGSEEPEPEGGEPGAPGPEDGEPGAPGPVPEDEPSGGGTIGSGGLAIVKIDAETGAYLEGATFALYRTNDNSLVGTYTTDENGWLSVGPLTYETYYFVEIEAPEGYVLDSTPIHVSLTSDLSYSAEYPWVIVVENTKSGIEVSTTTDTTDTTGTTDTADAVDTATDTEDTTVSGSDSTGTPSGTGTGTVTATARDAGATGDDSSLLLWLVLMLAAAAGLGAAVYVLRRQRR